MKIEKCKLQIEPACGRASSRPCGSAGCYAKRDLKFAFFNFQFSMSSCLGLLLPLLAIVIFAAPTSAQKKSSCIECHSKLDDTRLSAPANVIARKWRTRTASSSRLMRSIRSISRRRRSGYPIMCSRNTVPAPSWRCRHTTNAISILRQSTGYPLFR